MQGRFWTPAALLVALASPLAGCGGGSDGGDQASGEITSMVFGEPEEIKAFRKVITAFKGQERDIRVRLIEASDRDDLLAPLSTSFAGGTPPDVFLLNYRFYGHTIEAFDWDIAALPKHDQAAGILHSDAYGMTKASDRKDAAWRFMEFALGPEGQQITARSGRTVPSLKEVAESRAFLDPAAKPANSRVFLDTIDLIRGVPDISTWPEIEVIAQSEPMFARGTR